MRILSPRLSCVSASSGRRFALHFADGAIEHLGVKLEADGFDMPALFAAQHVAGAAQFEIEGRDLEAGAQVGKFFQRRQAPARDGGQLDFGRQQQVGVGAAIRAAHASAQLVKLGESQAVGAIDEDGVAERDIEAVLDDGGRDQDVGFVMHELEHHFFQFAFRHLAVTYDDARSRHQRLELGGDLPDAVHAVVHEVNLAAALEFLLDGGLDELLVPTGDHSLNRDAVLGRSFDHAHVAQADQGHVQRARNGRGRHGQHVHLLAHLLQAFFVAHAEALLFVHDQQAEVGELHVFRNQAMGADQDVDFAGFHLLQNFFLLLRRAEAADHFDGDRKRREALLESFVVLEGEDGGGREHGDLLVVADGLESGAHGDFGLAVTRRRRTAGDPWAASIPCRA